MRIDPHRSTRPIVLNRGIRGVRSKPCEQSTPMLSLAPFPSRGWKKYSRDVGNTVWVRTSSTNWAGAGGVTVEEGVEYARSMGFTK